VPMKFWFTKQQQPSQLEVLDNHKHYKFIIEHIDNLENITDISVLETLYKCLEEVSAQIQQQCMIYFPIPLSSSMSAVLDRINELSDFDWNDVNVTMSESETINGYYLYNGNTYFDRFLYKKLLPLWNSTNVYTFDKFLELYNKIPKSRSWWCNDNAKKLYDLPYSHDFLLATIDLSENAYNGSVRYCNYLCVLFDRQNILIKNQSDKIVNAFS
jgi:hypothetical protein